MADVNEIVEKVVENFIRDEYRRNPFNFLYESDIQGILLARLFEKFQNESIKMKIEREKSRKLLEGKEFIDASDKKTLR